LDFSHAAGAVAQFRKQGSHRIELMQFVGSGIVGDVTILHGGQENGRVNFGIGHRYPAVSAQKEETTVHPLRERTIVFLHKE
jgi:hypothetical protein